MIRPHHACTVFALLSMLALAAPAQSQIRRCVTGDGSHVYTDRACADLGASERMPRRGPGSAGGRVIRHDCSRRLQDLVFELTAAIDSRDVNRLAGIYHWPGTSSRTGYAIMGRLDAIVNRPLVDITPLQPPPPPPSVPGARGDALVWRTAPARGTAAVASGVDPSAAVVESRADPSPTAADQDDYVHRRPTGLIVDQTVANRITPMQTVFSLRRHLGCWWLGL